MQAVRSRFKIKLAPETKSALRMGIVGIVLIVMGWLSAQSVHSVRVPIGAGVVMLVYRAFGGDVSRSIREYFGESILAIGLVVLVASRFIWTLSDQRVYCVDGKVRTTLTFVMPWSTVRFMPFRTVDTPVSLFGEGYTLSATYLFQPNRQLAQQYFDQGEPDIDRLAAQLLWNWQRQHASTLQALRGYQGEVRFPVKLLYMGVIIDKEIVCRPQRD